MCFGSILKLTMRKTAFIRNHNEITFCVIGRKCKERAGKEKKLDKATNIALKYKKKKNEILSKFLSTQTQ